MATLHVDDQVLKRVERLAHRLGMSGERAIERGLAEFEAGLDRSHHDPNAPEWLIKFWRDHPLPPPTGLDAHKAFFDRLSGEEDV